MNSYFVGIDENGLGPVMGPLVVTGTCANRDFTGDWVPFIKDSKKIFRGRKKGLRQLEEIALSVFFAAYGQFPPDTESLLVKTCFFSCSKNSRKICLENIPDICSLTDSEGVETKVRILEKFLKENRIKIKEIKSVVVCPFEFNHLCEKKYKKDFIDFLQFEKTIKHFQKLYGKINVSAGKIGGRDRYMQFLAGAFPFGDIRTQKEGRDLSSYVFKDSGGRIEVNFIKNVEEKSFLAALSGIFGKYVRELVMESINRSLGANPAVSGYRDKNTREFLTGFLSSRGNNFDLRCIVRKK